METDKLIEALRYQAETIRGMNCTTMSAEQSDATADALETLTAQLVEKDKQVAAAVESLESVAHSGGNLCEVCGADCCDAGFDDPETFQCGCFKWRGPQEAGEGGG